MITIEDFFRLTSEDTSLLGEVENALASLYGSTAKTSAELWLRDLQQRPESWSISQALLSSDKPTEVRFYGAMTLYTKLSHFWVELPEHLHGEMGRYLMNLIMANSTSGGMVATRLCQCLAIYALQTVPAAWPTPISDIIHTLAPISESLLFETLAVLAEEFDRSKMTRSQKSSVRKALKADHDDLVVVLYKGLQPTNEQSCRMIALKALTQWVEFGLPIDEIQPHVALVAAAVNEEPLFEEAVGCLVSIFNTSDINRYPKCFLQIVPLALGFGDILKTAVENEDEECANGMSLLLITVIECVRPLIVTPESNIQIVWCTGLLSMLMQCTNFPQSCLDETVSQSTLAVWGLVSEWLREEFVAGHGFAEGKDAERRNAIMAAYSPLYVQLLGVLRSKLQYPPRAFGHDWKKDEHQQFQQLRSQYGDAFMFACAVVREDCLSQLHTLLQTQMATPEIPWQELESTLFCVRVVAEHLNLEIEASEWIPRLLELVLSTPRDNVYIVCQSLRTIGAYADWFISRDSTLNTIMGFVIPYLDDKSKGKMQSEAAAHAFYDICEVNAEKLTGFSAELFSSCIAHAFSIELKRDSRIRIIKGLCFILSAMPSDVCATYLGQIVDNSVYWLTTLTQQTHEEPHTVAQVKLQLNILVHICTSVDFDEAPHRRADVVHPIVPVVQKVAPAVCSIAELFATDEDVVKECCDIFNGALRNTSDDFLPFLEPYCSLLTSSYNLSPQAPVLASAAIVSSMYKSAENAQVIAPLVEALVSKSLTVLNQDLRNNTDLVVAFFSFLSKILAKADPIMLFRMDGFLPAVYQCAIASLELPERLAFKSTCAFLEQLTVRSCDRDAIEKDPIRYKASQVYGQYLSAITTGLVESIAIHAPRSMLKEPVSVVFAIKRCCPQDFQSVITSTVNASTVLGHVSEADKTTFLKRLINARKKSDLVPIANDFAVVTRRLEAGKVGYG
eukprot:CFRG6383T1